MGIGCGVGPGCGGTGSGPGPGSGLGWSGIGRGGSGVLAAGDPGWAEVRSMAADLPARRGAEANYRAGP